jgi:hypothetical protein
MSTFWALFDISAHARGGHGYSGPHTTGWQILSFFAGFYLLAGMYAILKHTLLEGGLFINVAVIAVGAALLMTMLFLGPIIVIAALAAITAGGFWLFSKVSERVKR